MTAKKKRELIRYYYLCVECGEGKKCKEDFVALYMQCSICGHVNYCKAYVKES